MKYFKIFFGAVKNGFKKFGENIALIINSILLSVVYILGIGLTAIISKICGKSFLDRKISGKEKNYWNNLN